MRIVLLGQPGSGKGTQAQRLAAAQGIPRLTTGEMLRVAVRDGAPLGKDAKRYMERGDLVPDQLIVALMQERMGTADCARGYILDGFPRTRVQAEALDAMLTTVGAALQHVLLLEVDEAEIRRRLSGRRECPKCGSTFHLTAQPPKVAGVCDRCQTALVQRPDDQEATIARRLAVYVRETKPLIGYYEARGLLRRVTAPGGPDEVFRAISSLITMGP
ncbi:MAG: adenylate kinase [Deltaproteobacteria bacterium]|nr:adenylate kinase [Deltaproteobacteria bacterium]